MHLGRYIFLGVLFGLAACIWITLMQPRLKDELGARLSSPTPLATPSQVPTSTPIRPAVTPVVAGQSSVKLLMYGVTLTVTDPINDLVYGEIKEGSDIWAGFTTEKLLAKYPACKAGALGTLVRTKATVTPTPHKTPTPTPTTNPYASPSPYTAKYTPTNQPFSKTIGGYTYSYRPSYSSCAPDQAGRDTLAAARAAVKNGALPTLSN